LRRTGDESPASVSCPAVSYQKPASAFSLIFPRSLAIHSKTQCHSEEASTSSRMLINDLTALL